MTSPSAMLNVNPLYNILPMVRVLETVPGYGLERTYHIDKHNKVLGLLRELPGNNDDLSRIDHNQVLDLYPGYEYIFGPYVDANEHEFNTVYLLYTNRINLPNEIKVVYAGRVIMEYHAGQTLPDSPAMLTGYESLVQGLAPIPGKLSNHCYYRRYRFSDEEKARLLQMYGGTSVSQPRYNPIRENFVMTVCMPDKAHVHSNPYRILYELYHAKRRLTKDETASPINGKKADLSPENVFMENKVEGDKHKAEEAMRLHGLDVRTLESIFASTGFGRFRGIYTHEGIKVSPSLKNRKYVKMVRDGTDEQVSLLLSRALMCVAEGRVLKTEEEVDHIDHNHMNDVISNLRILLKHVHTSEDSVRVEVTPMPCSICAKVFTLSNKAFSYYKSYPSPVTCTPQCRKKLRELPKEERKVLNDGKSIDYRYYILDKGDQQRLYFTSKDYDECRQELFKNGKPAQN